MAPTSSELSTKILGAIPSRHADRLHDRLSAHDAVDESPAAAPRADATRAQASCPLPLQRLDRRGAGPGGRSTDRDEACLPTPVPRGAARLLLLDPGQAPLSA